MYLNAQNIGYMLSREAILAGLHLLSVPAVGEKEPISAETIKNGLDQLQRDGYLQYGPDGENILSIELAFLLTGAFTARKALEWRSETGLERIACRFEGVYILLIHAQTGKWQLKPFRNPNGLISAIGECGTERDAAMRVVDRDGGQPFPPEKAKEYFEEKDEQWKS